MKIKSINSLILLLCGMCMVSCSDDDETKSAVDPGEAERNEYFKYDASQVEVTEETTFNVLDEMQKRIANLTGANSDEEKAMLEYYKGKYDELEAFAQHTADSIAAVNPGNSLEAIVGQVMEMGRATLHYMDLGADGQWRKMSMLVIYPTRFFVNINANNIILGCHFTITDDKERPTNTGFQGLSDACLLGAEWATTCNNLVIMPDYEGFGASVNVPQPYLIREVQARQCLKSLIVGMEWFTGAHGEKFNKGNVVIEGFSQGGAVAAATYRYWLEHLNEYWAKSTKTPILGAVCGDGPYDPLATLQYYCKSNWLSMPVAPSLVLLGLCQYDSDAIAAGLQATDFFSADFCKTDLFNRISQKQYSTTQCEWALHDCPGSMTVKNNTEVSASDAFNKETYEFFRDGKEPDNNPVMRNKLRVLKHCLEKNSLTYNFNLAAGYDFKVDMGPWTGSLPFHLTPQFTFFHGYYDTVVPYDNLAAVINKWGSDKIKVVRCLTNKDHGDMGTVFFIAVHNHYVQEMFNNEWKPGAYIN